MTLTKVIAVKDASDQVETGPELTYPASSNEERGSSRLRRPRLIDALTAQRPDSPESQAEQALNPPSPSMGHNGRKASPIYLAVGGGVRSWSHDNRGLTPKNSKVRVTYTHTRGAGGESNNLDTVGIENDVAGFVTTISDDNSNPNRENFELANEDLDEDAGTRLAIQSVHELRRAGVNHRFSDEVEDLVSRISHPTSTPSTMRRNALCELAQKLRREGFAAQFRDHATRDSIVVGIGEEADVISGFSLAASLVIFLSGGPAPHMLRRLMEEGVGAWLSRLLLNKDEISGIASRKIMNLSKATRAALHNVNKVLLQLPIWYGYNVPSLSPRTVALQLLQTLARTSDGRYVQTLVGYLRPELTKLTSYYAAEEQEVDLDFALVASVLEAQSSSAAALNEPVAGTKLHHSEVAAFLQKCLKDWPNYIRVLDTTILKLAINTTNDKEGAVAFNNFSVLSGLTNRICEGFGYFHDGRGGSTFNEDVYEGLLLILGITINIVEHPATLEASLNVDSVAKLVILWTANEASTFEVCFSVPSHEYFFY